MDHAFRQLLIARNTLGGNPRQPDPHAPSSFRPSRFPASHLVERAFCRLEGGRRIATRYGKLAANDAVAVSIAILVTWRICMSPDPDTRPR